MNVEAGRGPTEAPASPAFPSVACVVTSGGDDLEAVRQAAALAEGGRLTLIDAHPRGADTLARVTAAWSIAASHGLQPEVCVIHAPPTAPTVHLLAGGHDLLVVAAGAEDDGGLARTAVMQAPVPVLVVRPRSDGAAVTERILVAVDGSPEADAALSAAHEIGRRHGSALAALLPGPGTGPPAMIVVDLERDTLADSLPLLVSAPTGAIDAIVDTVMLHDPTLLVLGSRGLSGIAALASVSARVAGRVACSVLVVRPRERGS